MILMQIEGNFDWAKILLNDVPFHHKVICIVFINIRLQTLILAKNNSKYKI